MQTLIRSRPTLSRIYEIRFTSDVESADLTSRPWRARAGRFSGRVATAGQVGFARYDRRADRVIVALPDGRSVECEGGSSSSYFRRADRGNRLESPDPPDGSELFERIDSGRTDPPSVDTPPDDGADTPPDDSRPWLAFQVPTDRKPGGSADAPECERRGSGPGHDLD